jgi:hypothetical protein
MSEGKRPPKIRLRDYNIKIDVTQIKCEIADSGFLRR